MKNRFLLGAGVACLGLSLACGGSDREVATADPEDAPEIGMIVTGCLTSADGRYVLTSLEGTNASTESYQLTNAAEQLRQHVGKQVRIDGRVEGAQVAEVRESTPPAERPAGTSGQQGGGAQVSTESRTRLEMREIEVLSVEPTGQPCVER